MAAFVAIALSFPCVVYTVLLGAALTYWVFVIAGAAQVDLLGEGVADGALDGFDGHGHGDVGHHGDVDLGDGDLGDGHAHGLGGVLDALKLRSAPLTVTLSVLSAFSWLFSVLGMQLATERLAPDALGVVRVAIFVTAPLLALPFTSLAIRPLARLFAVPTSVQRTDLVGKVCRIRTGTVTDRFGEATVEDGGAGLVVRVRVDGGEPLARGDQAVIVAYDEEAHEFTIAKLDDEVLDEPKRRTHR